MNLNFDGVKISGVQLILPKREIAFDSEVKDYNFTSAQSAKLNITVRSICCSKIKGVDEDGVRGSAPIWKDAKEPGSPQSGSLCTESSSEVRDDRRPKG